MSYRDLPLWQQAMDLAERVCRAARAEARDERFLPFASLRRVATLVPSQIAHGHERVLRIEQLQAWSAAAGSLAEVETQLLLAARLGLLPEAEADALLDASAGLARRLGEALRRLDALPVRAGAAAHDD